MGNFSERIDEILELELFSVSGLSVTPNLVLLFLFFPLILVISIMVWIGELRLAFFVWEGVYRRVIDFYYTLKHMVKVKLFGKRSRP